MNYSRTFAGGRKYIFFLLSPSKHEKAEQNLRTVAKNNDGEKETSQMKIKINFHGAIFALPRQYEQLSRGTWKPCQNEIPQFLVTFALCVCKLTLVLPGKINSTKVSHIQMIHNHRALLWNTFFSRLLSMFPPFSLISLRLFREIFITWNSLSGCRDGGGGERGCCLYRVTYDIERYLLRPFLPRTKKEISNVSGKFVGKINKFVCLHTCENVTVDFIN